MCSPEGSVSPSWSGAFVSGLCSLGEALTDSHLCRGRPLQESFVRLVEACGDLEQSMDQWLSRLESCRWLAHVQEALSTACLAAQGMER